MFTVATRGSHPKQPEIPRPWLLGRAIERWQKAEIDGDELERAFQRAMVEVVAEQVAAGVEVVWDGQVRWDGPAEFILRKMNGVRTSHDRLVGVRSAGDHHDSHGSNGQLKPSAIHNPPRFEARVEWVRPILIDDYRFLADRSPVPVRPVLTGPYSLAGLTEQGYYEGRAEDLINDLARALHREMEGLEDAGAEYILIEEPLLTAESSDAGLFFQAAETLCEGLKSTVFLAPGNALVSWEEYLVHSPFGGICVDVVDDSNADKFINRLGDFQDRFFEFGLVNSRSKTLEVEDWIIERLLALADGLNPAKIWVAPSCGMGGLPREVAFQKLQTLHRAAERARREYSRNEDMTPNE